MNALMWIIGIAIVIGSGALIYQWVMLGIDTKERDAFYKKQLLMTEEEWEKDQLRKDVEYHDGRKL